MEKATGFFKKHKHAVLTLLILAAVGTALFLLFYLKIIKINTPGADLEVRGVDVSSYQGEIDWQTLSEELDFVFIKATEGSIHCDEKFEYNYTEAQKTHLRVGAYHFFSFDSEGKTQAENFIKNVPACENMLPPVVDVEFYGDYITDPKSADEVVPQLETMLERLEEEYGIKPVIYATGSAYNKYIKENFSDYDLWVRSVYFRPDEDWTFWQYSDTGRLDGYNGEEKHIDLNVFNGSKEDFERYCTK